MLELRGNDSGMVYEWYGRWGDDDCGSPGAVWIGDGGIVWNCQGVVWEWYRHDTGLTMILVRAGRGVHVLQRRGRLELYGDGTRMAWVEDVYRCGSP